MIILKKNIFVSCDCVLCLNFSTILLVSIVTEWAQNWWEWVIECRSTQVDLVQKLPQLKVSNKHVSTCTTLLYFVDAEPSVLPLWWMNLARNLFNVTYCQIKCIESFAVWDCIIYFSFCLWVLVIMNTWGTNCFESITIVSVTQSDFMNIIVSFIILFSECSTMRLLHSMSVQFF